MHKPTARLAMEDGSVWTGEAFGATGKPGARTAEVVFNTAMTGYQESLTDPSYKGQVLVSTAPIVGIYGVNDEDIESSRVHVAGFVVHELSGRVSNHRATKTLSEYLQQHGVLGVAGVDTRAITGRIRATGSLRGAICDDPTISNEQLLETARNAPSMAGQNLVPEVGRTHDAAWTEPIDRAWFVQPHSAPGKHDGTPWRVFALDCGTKNNILRHLACRGCDVTVVPHDTPAARIRAAYDDGDVDGLLVSNGPGDPAAVATTVATLRELLDCEPGETIPTFGICLGHQMLALAIGATTYKLQFGHRGANQPVRSELTRHVEITSQNHGFAVDADSLVAAGAEPTHVHLNDGTIAGFRMPDRPVFAVQHHPEASPGPHDAGYLFDCFVEMLATKLPPTKPDAQVPLKA